MALTAGCQETEISQFNGAITRLGDYGVPLSNGLYSQNCQYVRGQVSKRFGHSVIVSLTDGPITTLALWYFVFGSSQVSIALYYAPSVGIKGYAQGVGGGIDGPFITVTGAAGSVMVPTGERLYAAFYDATGRYSAAPGQIYGWNIGADVLFAPPMTAHPVVNEAPTGVITAGVHKVAYLFTTRNGYTGILSPIDSITGQFTPTSFTATGGKNLGFQISGVLPSYMVGGTIQVVMTTVANGNKYFTIPGATSIAGNPTTIIASISDDDLAATGTDVTAYMDLLATNLGGAPPFLLFSLFAFSSRMGYIGIDLAGVPVVYFSEPDKFQYLTADQHAIYLEANVQPVAGFSLRSVAYICTPFSLYSVEDNGDVPSTWTKPAKVDGSIGILSPTCVTVNTSVGYAALAADRGLYLFQGGVFPALPLSYYQQSDWERINWNVPTTVKVADDQLNKRFIVLAPLKDTVQGVSGSSTFTVVTAHNPHLYQTGTSVTITGVTGAQTITVTGPNTFTIPGGSGSPTVGGTISPQTATHEMKWDYTEGDTAEVVKYSLDSFGSYRAGAMATIQNTSTYLQEIWYAPAANGPMIRQNDGTETNPNRDVNMSGVATATSAFYETSLVPGPQDTGATVHDFHGMHMRINGPGTLTMLAKGIDGVRTITPVRSPLTLSATPGLEYLVKWFLRSEQQSIRIGESTLDGTFSISFLRAYHTEAMPQR